MDGDNGQPPMVVLPVPPPPEPKLLLPLHDDDHGKAGSRRRSKQGSNDDGNWAPIAIAVAAAVVILALLVGALGFRSGFAGGPGLWGGRHRLVAACPRPPEPAEAAAQFNAQQQEISYLRRRGFRGDFFAQLELASRYQGRRQADKNLQDPVEAAVWYALALANPQGYERTGGPENDGGLFGRVSYSLYDACRHGERRDAYRDLDRLLAQMSTDERNKVRNRATYVLSTEGADGFRTLARLHDVAYGPFGEPPDDGEAQAARSRRGWPDAVDLFERNAVDAYMFNYLAMQSGDEGAYVLLQDLKRSASWGGYADVAETRARRWTPPYEFYPPDAPDSGVPHSDESEPMDESDRVSLYRIGELPFKHVSDALAYLHVISKPVASGKDISEHDAETFQAMLARPATGHLSPIEKVRAIQFAAVNGSPHAQLVLAVMYAQGVGVPPDYARAFHWFQEADRQGSPEAKFAVATYFSEGLAGVADQEKAEAVVHQLDAALAGFKPSTGRLERMLERVSPGARKGWLGYARPEYQPYPGGGDAYGYGGSAADPGDQEDFASAAGDTSRVRSAPPRGGRRPPPPRRGPPGRAAPDNERASR